VYEARFLHYSDRFLGVSKGAIASRWRHLARHGLLAKANSRSWVVAAEPVEAGPELERDEGPFPRWILPIGTYVRISTSEFACTRYG
jgi:hypothetical protein